MPPVIWLFSSASAADLEGYPTFELYPGTAGLVTRPSRLGWEADPLVAVGASTTGSPELDLSVRPGAWTHAVVLALPASRDASSTSDGDLTSLEFDRSIRPFAAWGLARTGETTAAGLSVVFDGTFQAQEVQLDQLGVSTGAGTPSALTWDGDVPSRDEGDRGRVSAGDLDLALTGGMARIDGDDRPRLDLVARFTRAGERIRAAEGRNAPATTVSGLPGGASDVVVDSIVGANPAPLTGVPNRSAATFGVAAGLDRGGSLRDPAQRLELALEGGPTWPTFDETRIVVGQYGPDPVRTRIASTGSGVTVGGGLGVTFGWIAGEPGEDGTVRVRIGGRLDGAHEQGTLRQCLEGACDTTRSSTSWARLTVPAAVELRVSERLNVAAGLLPTATTLRLAARLTDPDDPEDEGRGTSDASIGLAARGGLRYEHRGWILAASLSGGSAAGSASTGGFGTPAVDVALPPAPALTSPGPVLSVAPYVWIGWRPPQRVGSGSG